MRHFGYIWRPEGESGKRKAPLTRCLLVAVFAVLIGGAWLSSGSGEIDRKARVLREQQFTLPATGKIALVEVDARSLAEIARWPWPRSIHGQIVDRLNEAGADTVAFDIDFSSHAANPADDEAFAAALQRFDGTSILPAFRQSAGANSAETIDSEPVPELREHAILASVNVFPDADGVMRRYSSGGETAGVPRPSMPALLANSDGATDESFWISNAIKPGSIPRFSAVDIVNGNFDRRALKGKSVLIGATAIEMGDRYATQAYGVQPGVVIQALAAETLLQGLDYQDYGPLPLSILALLICCQIALVRPGLARTGTVLGGLVVMAAVPFVTEYFKWGTVGSSTGMAMLTASYAALKIYEAIEAAQQRRMVDNETGLPNMLALERGIGAFAGRYLFVMNITNAGELLGLLGDAGKPQLYANLVRRLGANEAIGEIYLTDNGSLAWTCTLASADNASELASATATLFVAPVHPDDRPMIIQPAIGIERIGADSPREAIKNAVFAAGIAAERGNKWLMYDQAMSDRSGHDQLILAGVDRAIADGEIYFLFQPKYAFKEQRFCGAEALVRWNHPQFGAIPPDEFIPILEKSGRMAELTMHSVATIEALLRQWHKQGKDCHIAVNISAPLLSDGDFARQIQAQVRALGGARRLLKLEVTESAGIHDNGEGIKLLEELRALGCKVSIDDYGTGNSTLSYIKQFPADEIKIDKSFITNLAESSADRALVRSTIELAHELGMEVVAEGIEDAECAAMLAEMACDMGQGWHFAKPVPLDELERLFDAPASEAA